MDKESFIGAFNEWYDKHKSIVNERVHDKRIKKKTPPAAKDRALIYKVCPCDCATGGLSGTLAWKQRPKKDVGSTPFGHSVP